MPSKMAGNKGSTTPPHDAGSSATRLQRNLAEKQRRDKLNGFISELATIVPMVSMASKRLDKTSILRLSAAHLRIYQSSLSGRCKKSKNPCRWRPNFLSSEQIREMLEAVDGFLLVTTTEGKIMYISQSVEKFLGHQHIEMIGHSLFLFIHPSDTDMVRTQLQALCLDVEHQNEGANTSARCSLFCRMRERNQPRSEVLTYQLVHIVGHVTYNNSEECSSDEEDKLPTASRTNFLLKAFVRVVHTNPYNELSLTDAIQDEYVTRHSLDGTIIFADHRLSTITGHLPHEVYGMSAYEYIISEDIPIALFAHKLMFSHDRGQGLIVYRLRTRNEGFVYLKSSGFLHIEKPSSQVDHFVCVNKLMSDEDGEQELKKFSDHFTPHINDDSADSLYKSICAAQVSGLPAPASISLMSDIKVSVNGSIPQLLVEASHSNDKIHIKLEPADKSNSGEKKCVKFKSTSNNLLNSEIPQLQLIRGSYGERTCEKLSLESDNTERLFPGSSPLTESSLSANSPQSDDRSVLSPSHGTCSSPDTPYSPPSPEQLQQVAPSNSPSNSVEFTHLTPPSGHLSSEEGNVQPSACVSELVDRLSPSLPTSPILMDVDATSASCSNWKIGTSMNGSLEYENESFTLVCNITSSQENDSVPPDLEEEDASINC